MKLNNVILILILIITNGYSQQTVGVFLNDNTSFNGYTLIAPLNSSETYLIDNCGFIVNEWNESNYAPGASVYLLEDGSIMRTCRIATNPSFQGGLGGRLERYDWNDNLIWSYDIADSMMHQHHDVEVLPNGNILAIVYDKKSENEVLVAGRNPDTFSEEIWSEKVIELMPMGTDSAAIVWEWSIWDHLIQEFDEDADNFGSIKEHPELIDLNFEGIGESTVDWMHANAIDYNADLDQIIISARNYHEIWIIDHSTTTQEAANHSGGNIGRGGDLIYRWGNPQVYQQGNADNQILYGQHHPHWIPNGYKGGGKIMVYNNGLESPDEASRVQIINPPVNENGEYFHEMNSAYLPEMPCWSYKTLNFSDFVSGAQRLENGNTLICDGASGITSEIDTLNEIVWKYISPVGLNGAITSQGNTPGNNSLFRAYKYATDYPAFTDQTLTPTLPIELNPLLDNCDIFTLTSTNERWEVLNIEIIENPVREQLQIKNKNNEIVQFRVINLLGSTILSGKTVETISTYNVKNWNSGIYFLIATDEKNRKIYRQQIVKL